MSSLVNPDSLAATVDAVDEAFFWQRRLLARDRDSAARWIAARQEGHRGYAGLPAPTAADLAQGVRFFTGERASSSAGVSHTMGQEACRALRLLEVDRPEVRRALESATAGMTARLVATRAGKYWAGRPGHYCCATCSVPLWRHLAAGGFPDLDRQEWLTLGLRHLRSRRTDNGRWQAYPFHYLLLALTEIDLPEARQELRHAAAFLKRPAARKPADDPYAARRQEIARRALARC